MNPFSTSIPILHPATYIDDIGINKAPKYTIFYKKYTFFLSFTILNNTIQFNLSNYSYEILNTLSANPTKWWNTLKEFIACYRRIIWVCLTIKWGWRLKRIRWSQFQYVSKTFWNSL